MIKLKDLEERCTNCKEIIVYDFETKETINFNELKKNWNEENRKKILELRDRYVYNFEITPITYVSDFNKGLSVDYGLKVMLFDRDTKE